MSVEKENQKDNLENNIKRLSLTDKNLPKVKKHKKSFKKARFKKEDKVVPLLKPPSKRRKYDENGNLENEEKIHNKSGIIWDNKTIDEQYLDRKLHPRIKIDEPKTPYPDGDDNDAYQEGMNKLNEIKPTEELLNDVVNSLKENKSTGTGRNNNDYSFKNNTARHKKSYRDSLAQNNMQKREINLRFILTKEEYAVLMKEKAKNQDILIN